MKFLFWMPNHSPIGQRSLEDVIGIFGHQLRALGHEAVWDPANDKLYVGPGEINVIVEGFTDGVVEKVAECHAKGARFLCLATEEPTPTGFNHGRSPEMVQRQDCFVKAAPYLTGIFHLVPGADVTRWYAQHAPSAYVELGYAPALVSNRPPDLIPPDFDFGFFGTMSKRRMNILKRLAKIGSVKIAMDFPTQVARDREMRRAKVIVQIRKHEEMGLVSSSRCNTALCIGRPVVAEPHLLSKPWDEIVTFADTLDGFYDMARMARLGWRGMHAKQLENFKTKLTPEVCVERALREIGLVGERRAA